METQNNELEVMRQQLAILNKKLEGQEIINDRLMRQAMKNKMSWIRKYIWAEIIAVPFLILFFLAITIVCSLSFGPTIYISVMLIASVFVDYKINMIDSKSFLENNLTGTAMKLVRMKKRRIVSEVIQIPLILIWVVWFLYDIYKHIPSDGAFDGVNAALTGGFIGGIVGCIAAIPICIYLVRKMQRTNDEIIRQIQELGK